MPNIERRVYLPHYLIAPITNGEAVGKIIYIVDDKVIGEIPLIAKEEAQQIKKKSFFDRIFSKEN